MIKTIIKVVIGATALTVLCYGYSEMLDDMDRNATPQSQPLRWELAKQKLFR